MFWRFLFCCVLGVWGGLVSAQTPPSFAKPILPGMEAPKPGARDLCPVCGMLVAKYPHWVATIVYRDGSAQHFDGAKDFFKFWFDPGKYAKGMSRDAITAIRVTEFYDLKSIDAKQAYYVIGSDVLGPMGHEFVPLASLADAEEFLKEHKGKRILRFDQVARELPAQLDNGKF